MREMTGSSVVLTAKDPSLSLAMTLCMEGTEKTRFMATAVTTHYMVAKEGMLFMVTTEFKEATTSVTTHYMAVKAMTRFKGEVATTFFTAAKGET